jgi:hypothetical protein
LAKAGWGKLFFGLFIFAIGASWLAREMGWISFDLPWLALALMLLGASVLADWFAGCSR